MNTIATVFSETRFLADAVALARTIGAPCRDETIHRALAVFGAHFRTGAVLWKTTDRPGDHLCYRFFARERTDTLDAALRAGFVRRGALTELVSQWGQRFGPEAIESCDFDCVNGLAKTWVYLGGVRPAAEVLDIPAVPSALRARLPALHRAGMGHVRFAAADYRTSTVNIYFRIRGPLTHTRATEVLAAVGTTAPDHVSTAQIRALVPTDFCLAVTFSIGSGEPLRACFYALGIPDDRLPPLPRRIAAFFQAAPCHDTEVIRALGWSYSPTSGAYLKAEHAYCGDMAARLRDWDCYLSGSDHRDPVLDTPVG